jgi:hypothetical protein
MVRVKQDYLDQPEYVAAGDGPALAPRYKSIDGVHAVAVEPDAPVYLIPEALWAEYLAQRAGLRAIVNRIEAIKMLEPTDQAAAGPPELRARMVAMPGP